MQKINLKEKVNVTVTKDGAKNTSNSWKEGQVISCHPELAKKFEKLGLVTIGKPKPSKEDK